MHRLYDMKLNNDSGIGLIAPPLPVLYAVDCGE